MAISPLVDALIDANINTPGVHEARKATRAGLPASVAAPDRDEMLGDLAARVAAGTIDRAEVARELAAVVALEGPLAYQLRDLVSRQQDAAARRALIADRDAIGKAVTEHVSTTQRALEEGLAELRAAGVELYEDDDAMTAYGRPSIADRARATGSRALAAFERAAAVQVQHRAALQVQRRAVDAGVIDPPAPPKPSVAQRARAIVGR